MSAAISPHSTPRLARGLRAAVAAGLLLLAATGCGVGERDVITVRFWNGFTGPDGRTMLRLVKRFNEENPDVRVLMQRMDWATYYNKLFVAGMGGRGPDVFVIHADNLERFRLAEFIRPVDDLVRGPGGIDEADFVENVWAAVGRDGVHYGVPLDVHLLGLYYNKALFREAGIVDAAGEARPPATREEFMDALERLTRDVDGDGRPDQWGLVFTWYRTNMVTLMSQWGGAFFTPDYAKCTVDCPENAAALAFCVGLIREKGFVPPPENFDSWVGFRQGKVGMAFEGIYMLADLEKQTDLEYGAAPMPQLGERPAAWASSHTLCLRQGLDDVHERAAWRFIAFLSDHSLDWAEGGQIPVRKSLLDSDRFRGMEAQAAFAERIPDIVYLPRVPFIFEFQTEFDAAIEKALRGSAAPAAALGEATANIDAAVARYNEMLAEAGRMP
ncbi:MAG: ABC transporter substrate-binding protein [Candidatus Hydrogenedentes bacterium]|nr:ABC transporter substrate-binding protein [Candidatus Hydrogenedentota bacterium]